MGILKITTNLVANAKYRYKKFLSASYSSSIVPDVPASGGTCLVHSWWHPPYLKPGGANITSNKSLMLAVEHVSSSATRDYSVISTEGGSFKVVTENLPNFSMLRAQAYYDVLESCNKWMFLTCKAVGKYPYTYELLWNPTTYEVRPLPLFIWPPLLPDGSRLRFDWTCWGLGFDPSSEDYKVIQFGHMEYYDDEPHAVLFSLKAGSWKVIPNPHFPNIEPFMGKRVHINGITYWIACRLRSEYRCLSGEDDTPKDLAVVSFDFVNEKFPSLIPMIPKSDRLFKMSCFHIVEFDGSLAAIFCDSVGFEIWIWKSNTKWSLYSTYSFDGDDVCVESVLGLYKNDKALFQDSKGSLLLYDCHARELKDLGIRGSSLRVYPYVQST